MTYNEYLRTLETHELETEYYKLDNMRFTVPSDIELYRELNNELARRHNEA